MDRIDLFLNDPVEFINTSTINYERQDQYSHKDLYYIFEKQLIHEECKGITDKSQYYNYPDTCNDYSCMQNKIPGKISDTDQNQILIPISQNNSQQFPQNDIQLYENGDLNQHIPGQASASHFYSQNVPQFTRNYSCLSEESLFSKNSKQKQPINNGIIDEESERLTESFEFVKNEYKFQVFEKKREESIQSQLYLTKFNSVQISSPNNSTHRESQADKLKFINKPKIKKIYSQSRQKNLFKNFGNTLINFIQHNFIARDHIENRLDNNQYLINDFHNCFLKKSLNHLKNKGDFLEGWKISESSDNTQTICYKQLFKETSLHFFNNYAEKYVNESIKLQNKDIYIKAIPMFIEVLNSVSQHYKFKLSK